MDEQTMSITPSEFLGRIADALSEVRPGQRIFSSEPLSEAELRAMREKIEALIVLNLPKEKTI